MSNPSQITVSERIRREHDELREMLGMVHRTLSTQCDSAAQVAELFRSLHRHVQSHFDEEEQGGFFEKVTFQAPRLSERAEAIKDEHAWLSNAMRELLECAVESDGDGWWPTLESKFHAFSKDLMHHESSENELLLEAYGDDIGAAD